MLCTPDPPPSESGPGHTPYLPGGNFHAREQKVKLAVGAQRARIEEKILAPLFEAYEAAKEEANAMDLMLGSPQAAEEPYESESEEGLSESDLFD